MSRIPGAKWFMDRCAEHASSIDQLEYQASGAGASQCEKILAHLTTHANQWVAMPELYQVSGAMAVHSRIADLRRAGHAIDHRNEREPGRRTLKSFYRLYVAAKHES